MNEIEKFINNGGQIKVCRTRRAKGVKPLKSAFGGNRMFLSAMVVASASEAGMLRMGQGLRKYGN